MIILWIKKYWKWILFPIGILIAIVKIVRLFNAEKPSSCNKEYVELQREEEKEIKLETDKIEVERKNNADASLEKAKQLFKDTLNKEPKHD